MAPLSLASQLYSSSRAGVCPGHCHHTLIPASERNWTKEMLFLHPLLGKAHEWLSWPRQAQHGLGQGWEQKVASGAVRVLPFHPPWPKPWWRWGLGQVYFQELELVKAAGYFFPFNRSEMHLQLCVPFSISWGVYKHRGNTRAVL